MIGFERWGHFRRGDRLVDAHYNSPNPSTQQNAPAPNGHVHMLYHPNGDLLLNDWSDDALTERHVAKKGAGKGKALGKGAVQGKGLGNGKGEGQGKGQGKGQGEGEGPPLDSSPDPDWLEVTSMIDSRIDSLFPDSCTFRPNDRYSDLDVMAIYQRLIEWEEHGNDVPTAVLHMRDIVKTHRWSGFVLVD